MPKYQVALMVQVVVEAQNEREAERIAFTNGSALIKTSDAHVSASMHATKIDTR